MKVSLASKSSDLEVWNYAMEHVLEINYEAFGFLQPSRAICERYAQHARLIQEKTLGREEIYLLFIFNCFTFRFVNFFIFFLYFVGFF